MSVRSEIEKLIKDLKSEDRAVRRDAAVRLGEMENPEVVNDLVATAADPDTGVREAAEESLIRIGGKATVAAVIPLLKHQEECVRNLGVEVLERTGSHDLEAITALLEDHDHDVRKFGADILGNIGSNKAVPALIKAMADTNPNVMTSVIESLGKLRDESAVDCLIRSLTGDFGFESAAALGLIRSQRAIKPLLESARKRTSFMRFAAIESLGTIGDAAVIPDLLKFLSEKDMVVQKVILKAIGDISEDWLEEHIEQEQHQWMPGCFISALEDTDRDVRKYAIILLGNVNVPEGARRLIGLLKAEDEFLVPFIIQSMVKIGRKDVTIIKESLRSENDVIRKYAALIAGDVQNTEVVPLLIECAKDKNPLVRRDAVRSLGKLADDRGLETMITALRDEEEQVRKAAADGLGWLRNAEAVRDLFDLLGDESKDVAESAVGALIMIGGDKARTLLLGALGDDSHQVRVLVSYGLGLFGGIDSLDALKVALNDASWEVRKSAIESLTRIGNKDDVGELLQMSFSDSDPRVRISVLNALFKLCREEALDTFVIALRDPDQWVRYRAVKCLGALKKRSVADILLEVLTENEGLVQTAICEALARLGDKKVTDSLRDILGTLKRSQDEELRGAIVGAIEQLGSGEKNK